MSADYAVWQSNGSSAGAVPIALENTSNPVYSFNNDFKFLAYKGDLYFSGSCNFITSGFEPCKLTTTPSPLAASSFINEAQQRLNIENTAA